MPQLQIPDPRERALVTAADLAIRPFGWMRPRVLPRPSRRVLLLRLERIGDLLMVLDAIAAARAAWPDADLDLAVGSWNLPLARLIRGVTRIHTADVPWLARDGRGDSWTALVRKTRAWRRAGYDLVINFEPDIRSNFLAWMTGAPQRHGYWTGGGGAFLTDAIAYEPAAHVGTNARSLVLRASGVVSGGPVATASATARSIDAAPALMPPANAVARAASLVGHVHGPVVGVHTSGGRESKQWHVDRFADVARELSTRLGATIVLTGSEADRALVKTVADQLPGVAVINLVGALDLAELAALVARLDLLVTGDTGPMHVAAAMRTPLVALFGPSDPRRYGPTSPHQRILRVDLPCSPCGRVRMPPERCRGHVPECMDSIQVDAVVSAAIDLLNERAGVRQTATH